MAIRKQPKAINKQPTKDPKPIYVAFDTNIISYLSMLHGSLYEKDSNGNFITEDGNLIKSSKKLDPEKLYRSTFKYNSKKIENITKLYEMIDAGLVRPVVVNTVFQEINAIGNQAVKQNCMSFIQNFSYFPNYTQANMQQKREEICHLAEKYCTEYKSPINHRTYEPAMERKYCAAMMKEIPENDAFIMAESTVEGLVLITENASHFITTYEDEQYNRQNPNAIPKENKRQTIININKTGDSRGVSYAADNNNVPRPETLDSFIFYVEKGTYRSTEPRSVLHKAKDQLEM